MQRPAKLWRCVKPKTVKAHFMHSDILNVYRKDTVESEKQQVNETSQPEIFKSWYALNFK